MTQERQMVFRQKSFHPMKTALNQMLALIVPEASIHIIRLDELLHYKLK